MHASPKSEMSCSSQYRFYVPLTHNTNFTRLIQNTKVYILYRDYIGYTSQWLLHVQGPPQSTGHANMWGQPSVVDAKAHLNPPLLRVATPHYYKNDLP
jgi:hypothetical protein